MKTYMAKPGELQAKWFVVDATDLVVGRMATKIAMILMGKHRPEYTPHVDTGDFVVVTNAAKVRLTGLNKPTQRIYDRYSRYTGGRKVVTLDEMLATNPEKVVTEAVRRMLPKNKLAAKMLSKLKVYAGSEHPHQAQQPEALEL
jgi:large subunit ribosomal protein L13